MQRIKIEINPTKLSQSDVIYLGPTYRIQKGVLDIVFLQRNIKFRRKHGRSLTQKCCIWFLMVNPIVNAAFKQQVTDVIVIVQRIAGDRPVM